MERSFLDLENLDLRSGVIPFWLSGGKGHQSGSGRGLPLTSYVPSGMLLFSLGLNFCICRMKGLNWMITNVTSCSIRAILVQVTKIIHLVNQLQIILVVAIFWRAILNSNSGSEEKNLPQTLQEVWGLFLQIFDTPVLLTPLFR